MESVQTVRGTAVSNDSTEYDSVKRWLSRWGQGKYERSRTMPRFYVENKGKWNIYSTIVDDYLLNDFVDFKELKGAVIGEMVVERNEELDTLLTDKPRLNVMSYKEAEETRKYMNGGEEQEHE